MHRHQPAVLGAEGLRAVARRLGRRFVGVDMNPKYLQLAQERIQAVPLGMAL